MTKTKLATNTYSKLPSGIIVPHSMNVNPKKAHDSTPLAGLIGAGGYKNSASGAGGVTDKTAYSYFVATRIDNRQTLETLWIESWAAGIFIDAPIDDMFIRWREFSEMSDQNVEKIQAVEKELQLENRLNRAMKAGRLYGSGFVVMVTKEAPLTKPLNIDRIQPGDLLNLLVFDRFDTTVQGRIRNIASKNYGQPQQYRFTPRDSKAFEVHPSRVLRFDGKTPLSMSGWDAYDQDFGVPELIPVICEIIQDSGVSRGTAHMVDEASIPVQKIPDLKDALAGCSEDDELSLADRMQAQTLARSIYGTTYMDKEDELTRVEINFAGLPELLDRSKARLAAAAKIPATRFLGQAPLGLNATGDGDMKNYAVSIGSNQEDQLTDPLFIFDQVAARSAGINEPINYEFPSLIDISDSELADILLKKSQALTPLLQLGLIDRNEGRESLDGDPIIGNLNLETEEIEELTEFRKEMAAAQIETPRDPVINKDSWLKKLKNKFSNAN
jgi:phage-related protein (TIGR01555 family)